MVFKLLVKQFLVFIFGYFTYFGIFNEGDIVNNQLLILITIITTVSVVKFSWLFLLKKYRSLGNNFRTTIVIGFDNSTKNIIKLFKSKSNLGYKYLGFFSNNIYKNNEYLGGVDTVFDYAQKHVVDEIYCSLSSLNKKQIKKINWCKGNV